MRIEACVAGAGVSGLARGSDIMRHEASVHDLEAWSAARARAASSIERPDSRESRQRRTPAALPGVAQHMPHRSVARMQL